MQHSGAMAYARVSQTIASPRELEAALLMKAAHRLQAVAEGWANGTSDLVGAITFNRKVWTVLSTSATEPDNPLPQSIKSNIAQLATTIFQRTIDVQIEPAPQKLTMLIRINRDIATGLRSMPVVASAAAAAG